MQVFYSQMCDLIKLGLNGRVFQCPPSRVAFFIPIIYMRVCSVCRSVAGDFSFFALLLAQLLQQLCISVCR